MLYVYRENIKAFVSDNKRHKSFDIWYVASPNGILPSCDSVVKMAPSWRSQRSCGFYFSLTLPHGTVGWPAVCDCGISWSHRLS